MKKIILIIVGLAMFGCSFNNQDTQQQMSVCKPNNSLKDSGIKTVNVWGIEMQLTKEQLDKQCSEIFELNSKQESKFMNIIEGVYKSSDEFNVLDESLNTNLQAFATPKFYDQTQDPIMSVIKKKIRKQKIEINKHEVILNGEKTSKMKIIATVQNEQDFPFSNFAILINNYENQEKRILLSSKAEKKLKIIEEYDLRMEGYDIYKVYHYLKRNDD